MQFFVCLKAYILFFYQKRKSLLGIIKKRIYAETRSSLMYAEKRIGFLRNSLMRGQFSTRMMPKYMINRGYLKAWITSNFHGRFQKCF